MAQVTLVERNAFASLCAATHIRNGFSYGSDGYWPGWMMKLGRSTGHAFPTMFKWGGKGMVDFADGLTEAELDTQLEAWFKEGIKRACP